MMPKQRKVGDEIEIICPSCDGEGSIIISPEQGGIPVTCNECGGCGKLKGIVTQ